MGHIPEGVNRSGVSINASLGSTERGPIDGTGIHLPVSREQARAIVEAHLRIRRASLTVSEVTTLAELESRGARAPGWGYVPRRGDWKDAWIAYLDDGRLALRSSHIIVLSQWDGTVWYEGSAFDEG